MRDLIVRQLRRISEKVAVAHEASDQLRLWRQAKGTDRGEQWRQGERLDIALGDATHCLSFLTDWVEHYEERTGEGEPRALDSELAAAELLARRFKNQEVGSVLDRLVRLVRFMDQKLALIVAYEPEHRIVIPPRSGGLRMTFLDRSKEREESLFCPMVYCDGCGRLIEGYGNVLYEVEEKHYRPATGEMFFFHKGCDRVFEQIRGGTWHWDELSLLPMRLAANLNLEVKRAGSDGYHIRRRQAVPSTAPRNLPSRRASPPHPSGERPRPVSLDPRRQFNAMQKQEIFLRSNGHCCACGQELGLDWHADHIYPHSLGGITEVINGQALCQPCNQRKHAKILTVDEEG